jgi:signal transduction histidine kinase
MADPRLTDPTLLRRLIDVSRSVVSELDVEVVLRRVIEEACDITGARYGAVGVLNERRDGLERFITTGIDDETHRAIGDLPRGRGVLGVLITDPTPLRLADVGSHPRSYGFPPQHPPMRTFLGMPVRVHGEAYGHLYLTEKADGATFDEVDEEAVSILADTAGIAIHNARLYQQVERRRDELERAVVGLEATTEIARAVGGETDLDRILELIAKRGRALVKARTVVILLEEEGELRVVAAAGDTDEAVVGQRIPLHDSVYADVFRSRRPERISDLPARLRSGSHAIGVDAHSALAVPLVFKDRALGVLVVYDHQPDAAAAGTFTMADQQLLLSFAASAATAVATAKTVAQEDLRHSIQAAEQERRRWARELHDETLQGLGALSVLLSSGLGRDLETPVHQALSFIEEQIASLRALISDLRPAVLDELGIQPALEALVERGATPPEAAVDLEVDLAYGRDEATTRLIPDIENAIYRLVQEALTNVIKHSGARRVSIAVRESDGSVRVEVTDNGSGFDITGATGGFGLVGMRERAELVGGKLAIASQRGEGTTVSVVLPATHLGTPAAVVRTSLHALRRHKVKPE